MSAIANAARRILIIEDDELMGAVYCGIFERLSEEFRVTLACDAAAVRELLAAGEFDAAVLDWDLPDADGLSLLAPLRARGVRVLMASGRAQAADRALALGSGADDYLSKPFSAASLLARLRALLQA